MKNTNESDLPVRQLIKFSNYSLCITLPKDFIDNLGWQQGDRISFQLTKENNLMLAKQGIVTSENSTSAPDIAQAIPDTIVKQSVPEISQDPSHFETTPVKETIANETVVNEPISIDNFDNLEPIPQLN